MPNFINTLLARLQAVDFDELMREAMTGDAQADWLRLRTLELAAQKAVKPRQGKLADAKRRAWMPLSRGELGGRD